MWSLSIHLYINIKIGSKKCDRAREGGVGAGGGGGGEGAEGGGAGKACLLCSDALFHFV